MRLPFEISHVWAQLPDGLIIGAQSAVIIRRITSPLVSFQNGFSTLKRAGDQGENLESLPHPRMRGSRGSAANHLRAYRQIQAHHAVLVKTHASPPEHHRHSRPTKQRGMTRSLGIFFPIQSRLADSHMHLHRTPTGFFRQLICQRLMQPAHFCVGRWFTSITRRRVYRFLNRPRQGSNPPEKIITCSASISPRLFHPAPDTAASPVASLSDGR